MTYADPGLDPDVIHVCARCDAEYPSEIAAYRCCPAEHAGPRTAAGHPAHTPGDSQ